MCCKTSKIGLYKYDWRDVSRNSDNGHTVRYLPLPAVISGHPETYVGDVS